MSNKPRERLWEIDRRLRRIRQPLGPRTEGTQFRTELFSGFELFNTRPYHNFETWSDGWRITVPWIELRWPNGDPWLLTVEAEDLDDAVTRLEEAIQRWQEHPEWSIAQIVGSYRDPESFNG